MGFAHLYYYCLSCIYFQSLIDHFWILFSIIFSILVISLLINPVSCDQDPILTVISIHDFHECVTGIFSIVTVDDIIRDSGILDMVVPLGILFALVNKQIGQGYYKSGRIVGRPSMSPFLSVHFILEIYTRTKHGWIIWDRFCFWYVTDNWNKNILVYLRVDFDSFHFKIF